VAGLLAWGATGVTVGASMVGWSSHSARRFTTLSGKTKESENALEALGPSLY